jgi:YD repeat-containing protein
MIEAATPEQTITYQYDPFDRRLAKKSAAEELYDGH